MKNRSINRLALTVSMFLAVTITSCNKEGSIVKPTEQIPTASQIKVTGEDAGSGSILKSTLNGQEIVWIAGTDKVGIYSSEARTATAGGGAAIVNAPFTAVTAAKNSAFTGTMYWGAATTLHNFYAYYPYVAGSAASTVVPVSLAAAQTQSAADNSDHIGALDFLVATPASVTSPANTNATGSEVGFKYNHLFTVLVFQITGTAHLTQVRLSGPGTLAFSGGTIDITQSTPATGTAYAFASQTGTTGTAIVTTARTILNGTPTSVYMVINPSVQTGNYSIGLKLDGEWKYISKAPPSGGFVRGKKYTVAVSSASATALAIGSTFGGGKVAYILQSGDPGYDANVEHGLIAATADQSTGIIWTTEAYQSTLVPASGAVGTAIGTGSANTTAIIAQAGAGTTYAAGLARAYNGGGYSDWYLPSKDELNKLYINQAAIGGFASNSYWSSSEFNNSSAHYQYFVNGATSGLNKSNTSFVRAVRAF